MELIMKNELMTYNRALTVAKEIYLNMDSKTGEVHNEQLTLNPIQLSAIEKLSNPSLDDLKMAMNIKCGYPARRGFAWSKKEDDHLIKSFNQGKIIKEISKSHHRSQTAVLKRLQKFGLITQNISVPTFKNMKRFSIRY